MDYFSANPKPASLDRQSQIVRSFIHQHASQNRRVALVTSGGTTVPLENQTVRFIDNFSAGTRGATSAEYFLEASYAVIFLHRQFSLLPYSRHYSHSTNCFLDFMTFSNTAESGKDAEVVVDDEYQNQMADVLKRYRRAKKENTLLLINFTTVNEYLWYLREIAMAMQPLGANGLFYLAAAVSDFFVPADRMVEHKIQSSADFNTTSTSSKDVKSINDSTGTPSHPTPAAQMSDSNLIISLDPVPKFLKTLVDTWAPRAMIISFKLETDPDLLSVKSRTALEKYAHHLVIGNLLNTRKYEVLFVSAGGGEKWLRVPEMRRTKSNTGLMNLDVVGQTTDTNVNSPIEIESWIVPEVKALHDHMIEHGDPRKI